MPTNGNSLTLTAMYADGIAKQKLNVMLIVDTSRSMQGERIKQVNKAIFDIHKYLIDLQDENSNVDFYMSIMTFAETAAFLEGYKSVNVKDMIPPKLKVRGPSNLHCAYEALVPALQKESAGGMMPDFGGVAPIILLLTDGHASRSVKDQIEKLKSLLWFRASLRYGIAIELNDERTMGVLTDFTDDRTCVIECMEASTLSKLIRVIVVTASKVKSQSSAMRLDKSSRSHSKSIIYSNPIKHEIAQRIDDIDEEDW